MYSLDINFLNDRAERAEVEGVRRPRQVSESPRPLYIGAFFGVLLLALAGGGWLLMQTQRSSLQSELDQLNAELVNVEAALNEVESIRSQVQQIDQENKALASVFDRIQPWSALFEDFRNRTPAGVQLASITQLQPEPEVVAVEPTPADPNNPGAAPPPPPTPELPPAQLTFEGFARSFDDVNDFVLLLQQSPFLDGESVQLSTASLVQNPTSVEFPEEGEPLVDVQLPDVVNYSIQATVTDRPASELLQNMRSSLAVGLPARIDAIRELGVVEP